MPRRAQAKACLVANRARQPGGDGRVMVVVLRRRRIFRKPRFRLERWFAQADTAPEDRVPVREGRRNQTSGTVLEPLAHRLADDDRARLTAALGIVLGTDSMLALIDGVGLNTDQAKTVMLDAARWLLAGALAELDAPPGR